MGGEGRRRAIGLSDHLIPDFQESIIVFHLIVDLARQAYIADSHVLRNNRLHNIFSNLQKKGK